MPEGAVIPDAMADTAGMTNGEFEMWFRACWRGIRIKCGKAAPEEKTVPDPELVARTLADLEREFEELDALVARSRKPPGRRARGEEEYRAMRSLGAKLRDCVEKRGITRFRVGRAMGYGGEGSAKNYFLGVVTPSPEAWAAMKEAIRTCVKDNLAG